MPGAGNKKFSFKARAIRPWVRNFAHLQNRKVQCSGDSVQRQNGSWMEKIYVALPRKNMNNALNKHLSPRSPEHSVHFSPLVPIPFSLVSLSPSVGRQVGGIPEGESKARQAGALGLDPQLTDGLGGISPRSPEAARVLRCHWCKSEKEAKNRRGQSRWAH